ncbi:MAG: hypothetical protein MSJ26_07430 [Oscillospiraceae bacterium]|nr:hypothetical protein [Oscillospiraceae bacterium]
MSEKTISHVQGKSSIARNNRVVYTQNVDKSKTHENITYANITRRRRLPND